MRQLFMLAIAGVFLLFASPAWAWELSGKAGVEGRFYPESPLYGGQARGFGSAIIEPEFYHDFGNNLSFTAVPFARLDSYDENRTHVDMREFYLQMYGDVWEVRLGVDKVYWGAVESTHLVDVINQTDSIESFTGDEKLGQPMAKLSFIGDVAILDFYLLPYFRERSFAGRKSRLRAAVLIEQNLATYESSEKERHVDGAARLKLTLGGWEVALSHFIGTNKEPTLLPVKTAAGVKLSPYYEQVQQTGAEVTWVAGDWLWKAEGVHKTGLDAGNYSAATTGFEYTFYGLFGSLADIGFLAELAWDERRTEATTAFNNDILGGFRLALNDVASTELLFLYSQDYVTSASALSVEGSRRISSSWRITIEALLQLNAASSDLSYSIRKDSQVQLELAYYY